MVFFAKTVTVYLGIEKRASKFKSGNGPIVQYYGAFVQPLLQ